MRTKLCVLLFVMTAAQVFALEKMKTETLKGLCDVWMAAQDNQPKLEAMTMSAVQELVHKFTFADRCAAFVNGASSEMFGELSWLDETHKKIVVGNWEDGVSNSQEIRIFVEYVNQNPALLNKPAVEVLRKSLEAAGIYTYVIAP
jgi:hypothetical protein